MLPPPYCGSGAGAKAASLAIEQNDPEYREDNHVGPKRGRTGPHRRLDKVCRQHGCRRRWREVSKLEGPVASGLRLARRGPEWPVLFYQTGGGPAARPPHPRGTKRPARAPPPTNPRTRPPTTPPRRAP